MQTVNIFININHTGHLKAGTGTYSMVLEYITQDGTPVTLEIFGGLKNTTKNRTALYSCIEALFHLKKNCDVTLYINSKYITETINQGWYTSWDRENWTNKGKAVKNSDLWQQLLEYMGKHCIGFSYSEFNQYTAYMDTMVKRVAINYKEDKLDV